MRKCLTTLCGGVRVTTGNCIPHGHTSYDCTSYGNVGGVNTISKFEIERGPIQRVFVVFCSGIFIRGFLCMLHCNNEIERMCASVFLEKNGLTWNEEESTKKMPNISPFVESKIYMRRQMEMSESPSATTASAFGDTTNGVLMMDTPGFGERDALFEQQQRRPAYHTEGYCATTTASYMFAGDIGIIAWAIIIHGLRPGSGHSQYTAEIIASVVPSNASASTEKLEAAILAVPFEFYYGRAVRVQSSSMFGTQMEHMMVFLLFDTPNQALFLCTKAKCDTEIVGTCTTDIFSEYAENVSITEIEKKGFWLVYVAKNAKPCDLWKFIGLRPDTIVTMYKDVAESVVAEERARLLAKISGTGTSYHDPVTYCDTVRNVVLPLVHVKLRRELAIAISEPKNTPYIMSAVMFFNT